MVTADLRESACERGGRAAGLPTVLLHFYRDCTLGYTQDTCILQDTLTIQDHDTTGYVSYRTPPQIV